MEKLKIEELKVDKKKRVSWFWSEKKRTRQSSGSLLGAAEQEQLVGLEAILGVTWLDTSEMDMDPKSIWLDVQIIWMSSQIVQFQATSLNKSDKSEFAGIFYG